MILIGTRENMHSQIHSWYFLCPTENRVPTKGLLVIRNFYFRQVVWKCFKKNNNFVVVLFQSFGIREFLYVCIEPS